MLDPWADRMGRIIDAVRNGPGALGVEVRKQIMDGAQPREPLADYVAKVAAHPRQVTEQEVKALLAAGYTEDQIFEATVSAALGAGLARLRVGIAAMEVINAS